MGVLLNSTVAGLTMKIADQWAHRRALGSGLQCSNGVFEMDHGSVARVAFLTVASRLLAAIAFCYIFAIPAESQEIWFGPPSPNAHSAGSIDWAQLFKPSTGWSEIARRFKVFEVTAGYVIWASDAQLREMGAALASRQIGLSIGLQSIAQMPGQSCGQEEGYGSPMDSARAAARLASLGVNLESVGLDEPLWFGHYDLAAQACRLPISEIAKRVALNVMEYRRHFPKLRVYTIEPVPGAMANADWQQNFKVLVQSLYTAIGTPVDAVYADVNWSVPQYIDSLTEMAKLAHEQHLLFGMIYNGDSRNTTDATWVAAAKRHIDEVESDHKVAIDLASMQTWDSHPTYALPSNSDAALGSLVNYYLHSKTRIHATRLSFEVRGQLLEASGSPIAGARVRLRVIGANPMSVPDLRSVTSVVPANARFAIMGMRVNTECNCAGPNDLLVGTLRYSETEGGNVAKDYEVPGTGDHAGMIQQYLIAGQKVAHLVVRSNEHFGFNSPEFSITPGARFAFTVPLGAIDTTGLFGSVTLIWLDADHKGLFRDNVVLQEDARTIHTVVTDNNGWFRFLNTTSSGLAQRTLRIEFDGDMHRRGSVSYLTALAK